MPRIGSNGELKHLHRKEQLLLQFRARAASRHPVAFTRAKAA